jgi:signal transduction histidine kinase
LPPLSPADLPNLSAEEAELLTRHFEIFSDTTNKLVSAHQSLQGQIRLLVEELEKKNQQLEAVNKELARKMEETEKVRGFLDRLIGSMQTGMIAFDSQGIPTLLNRSAERLLGWEGAAPTGASDLFEAGSPNPLSPLELGLDSSRSGEIRLRTRAGGTVLARFTAVRIQEPQGNSESEDPGYLFVFEDLSHLRLLEEKVRRSDRLAALGELAAGVAHEMRNPLATMRGFLQLLPSEYEDAEFREECSTRLIREIDRLASLTDELLELSRPIQPEGYATDLEEVLREVLGEQHENLRQAGVNYRCEACPLPRLPLDRGRIKQVILNLVINASQAMPDGGELTCRLSSVREQWGETGEETELARLSIIDTGVGIESRQIDSVFDPFFTTKSQGTGLGLAISHRIVEEHGGAIRVESTVGKGSSFHLFFPLKTAGR